MGAPTDESQLRVLGKSGVAAGMTSRADTGAPLNGTKRLVVRSPRVWLGHGQRDGRSLVLCPLYTAGRVSGLGLVHVRIKEDLSLRVRVRALKAVGRYEDLKCAVTEWDLRWDDAELESFRSEELLTANPERLAERIRQRRGGQGALRNPLVIAIALSYLASKSGVDGPRLEEETTEILEEYVARGAAPLHLPLWLARKRSQRGDLAGADSLLEQGLKRLPPQLRDLRGTFLFRLAAQASDQGDNERGLDLLGRALELSEDATEVTLSKLIEAQLHLRLGDVDPAVEAVRIAQEFFPEEGGPELKVQLKLISARVHLEGGRIAEARRGLSGIMDSEHARAAEVRSDAKALEASILNAEEKWREALDSSKVAIALDPSDPTAQLARLEALSGLGRTEEARAAAKALARDANLLPWARAAIKAWQERSLRDDQGR